MAKRLTEESRQYLVRKRSNRMSPSQIARDLGITVRYVRRLWARFQVLALRDAIGQFGVLATILFDNGSCFVGRDGRRKAPTGTWKPMASEAELLDRGIELINSRPYRPQTNNKLERFFRSVGDEIWHHDSMSSYIEYNEEKLHFSLDIYNRQMPLRVFSDKKATDAIRKTNPKWMEGDTND